MASRWVEVRWPSAFKASIETIAAACGFVVKPKEKNIYQLTTEEQYKGHRRPRLIEIVRRTDRESVERGEQLTFLDSWHADRGQTARFAPEVKRKVSELFSVEPIPVDDFPQGWRLLFGCLPDEEFRNNVEQGFLPGIASGWPEFSLSLYFI